MRLALAIVAVLWQPLGFAVSPERSLLAGAASATVSPVPGAFIAGDARDRRFAGEHDPLFARALVLQSGGLAMALVVVDNIGLVYPDIERMRQRTMDLVGGTPLSPERIVVASTHTHSGPDVVGLWGASEQSSGRDPVYMDHLTDTVARQVAVAAGRLRPVTLRVASGEHALAWVHNVSQPGLLDRRVAVAQFLDAQGRTVATLTNFACHPTVMDAASDQVSSDYVGGFYRALGRELGGQHLFLQGAIGGWVQPDKRTQSFEVADRYGADVARVSLGLLEHAQTVPAPRLRFRSRRVDLPLDNAAFASLIQTGVLERELFDGAVRTEIAWFALGDVEFLTHPGETSPVYSLESRRLMGARHTFVLGLALDALGYILPPDYFRPGAPYPSADYLTATSLGPRTAPLLMSAVTTLTAGSRTAGGESVPDRAP